MSSPDVGPDGNAGVCVNKFATLVIRKVRSSNDNLQPDEL